MKKNLICLLLFTVSTLKAESEFVYQPQTTYKIGLLGTIIYPGITLGIDRPYKYKQIDKIKTKSTRTVFKERSLSAHLGMYHQNYLHTGIFAFSEWNRTKRNLRHPLFTESAIGFGFNKTFVDGPTFEVDAKGNITQKRLAGNGYAFASLSGTLGYTFHAKTPFSLYIKHQWFFQFPHNGFINPRPFLEMGYRKALVGIWDAQPKYIHKVKNKIKK